jgi:TetR/AcrR family transcriptional regulator, transcriptional repressor for nem operon
MAAKQPAYRQREALILAGFELAEKPPGARLTEQMLAKHAGLPTRSLAQQFGGLERFAETLQDLHYEEIRRHTLGAMSGLGPGIDRILRGVQAYFDFAFTRRGLRSWMSELRMRSTTMQSKWRVDNQLYVQFLATELALIGWPHPLVGARLFIAAVVELTRHEQQEGRRLPAARRALEGFLRTHEHAAGFV